MNALFNGIGAGLINTTMAVAAQAAAGSVQANVMFDIAYVAYGPDGTTSCGASIQTSTTEPPTIPPSADTSTACYGQWYIPSVYEQALLFNAADSTRGKTCQGNEFIPLPRNIFHWTSNAPMSTVEGAAYVLNAAGDIDLFKRGDQANLLPSRPIHQF